MGRIWTGREDWGEHIKKNKYLSKDPVARIKMGDCSDWNRCFVMESTGDRCGKAGLGRT